MTRTSSASSWRDRMPPADLPVPDLPERLGRVLDEPAGGEQRALFRDVERLVRERGHGAVIHGWEPDVAWLRGMGPAADHATDG